MLLASISLAYFTSAKCAASEQLNRRF